MQNIKILIADDETRMLRLVSDFLKKEGYTVFEATDGQKALDIFEATPDFDLVILDVMMPFIDGYTVCREIRKTSNIPIIMLTAKSQENDELHGFEIGADEYVTKPFSPIILIARVNSLLKRTGKAKKSLKIYDFLKIDDSGRNVFVNGTKIDLSPKEYDLLTYLTNNEGIALSRDQILNSVWGYDYFGDGRTVDTHIKKLRLKLGLEGDHIQTVRSHGYKFEVIK